MLKLKKSLVLLVVLSMVASFAGAAVIAPTHVGDANPETEGFGKTNYSGVIIGSAVGGNWRMLIDKNARYTGNPVLPAEYTFTATGYVQSAALDLFGFGLKNGSNGVQLAFLADGSGIWDRRSTNTYAVDTSVEHIYQVYRDGAGAYSTYVDGVKAFDMDGSGTYNEVNVLEVMNASSAMDSISYWKLWQFDSGNAIVPEPATMSLLGIAGLVALIRRRR